MEQIARDYGTDPAPAEGSGVLPVKTMTQTQIGAIGEVTVAAQLMAPIRLRFSGNVLALSYCDRTTKIAFGQGKPVLGRLTLPQDRRF